MFATYSLNIRRLLTQSIRRRPNLHVKSEHLTNIPRILVSHIRYVYRTIAEYSLAVRENCSLQYIFFRKGINKTYRNQLFSRVRVLYHQYSITNHSESILKPKIISILMIIFVVVFFYLIC